MTMVRTALLALLGCVTVSAPALAGGSLEARYTVSFTGVPIGQGAFVVEVNEDGYSASGSAMVAGLLQMVHPAKGSAAARGLFVNGKLAPISYSGNSENKERTEEVRLSGAGGTIRDVEISPERPYRHDRIPLRDEHRSGVVDPMSAVIMPVWGNGDLTGPEACNRTLPVFDGTERYDLVFYFERTESAKDVRGYSGPLAVCRVEYRPIAGHRANRRSTKELSENKNIFVWLAPIAGTRILVPQRVSFGSKLGVFLLQATHFRTEVKTAAPATR
jgi:hypothetical protein